MSGIEVPLLHSLAAPREEQSGDELTCPAGYFVQTGRVTGPARVRLAARGLPSRAQAHAATAVALTAASTRINSSSSASLNNPSGP